MTDATGRMHRPIRGVLLGQKQPWNEGDRTMHEEITPVCDGCGGTSRPVYPYALIDRSSSGPWCGRLLCDACARRRAINVMLNEKADERMAGIRAHDLMLHREHAAERRRLIEEGDRRDAEIQAREERKQKKKDARSISAKRRYAILIRDEFTCQTCGRQAGLDGITLHVDHMQPVSKGGSGEDENLWTLCSDCNSGKGARLHE